MDIHLLVRKNIKIIVAVVILLVVFPLLYSVVCFAISKGTQSPTSPLLELVDPERGPCVEDPMYMRFNHWKVLYEVRDEAMREGKEPKINFRKCQSCHTSREKFCDRCHNVVNFYPDCFDCHYYP